MKKIDKINLNLQKVQREIKQINTEIRVLKQKLKMKKIDETNLNLQKIQGEIKQISEKIWFLTRKQNKLSFFMAKKLEELQQLKNTTKLIMLTPKIMLMKIGSFKKIKGGKEDKMKKIDKIFLGLQKVQEEIKQISEEIWVLTQRQNKLSFFVAKKLEELQKLKNKSKKK